MADTYLFMANVLDQATLTLSTGTEDSDYPIENAQDRDKKTIVKPGGSGSYILDADAGEDASATAIIIPNNNAYTAGITGLFVQCDDNAGFSSPTNCVGSGAGSPHAPASDNEPVWYELFHGPTRTKTDRYWRTGFVGANTTLRFGDIYLVKRIEIVDAAGVARHPGGPWEYTSQHEAEVTENRGFISATAWGDTRDLLTVNFVAILKTLVDEILAAEKSAVRGNWLPWWYMDEYGVLKHVRLASPIRAGHHIGEYWWLTMRLKEEP